jgi:hypothetical protein
MSVEGIPLHDAITELRKQLIVSMTDKRDDRIALAVTKVEVAVTVEVTQEAGSDKGLTFTLLGVGLHGNKHHSSGQSSTIDLRIELDPTLSDGGRVNVAESVKVEPH